jgi:chromosome segregation ATPase
MSFMDNKDGKFCEYRDYVKLEAEMKLLQSEVEFWKSASTDNGIACNQRANENQGLENEIASLKADLAKSEEHNDALCERMSDLNSELFGASNINAKLHMERVHDLNQMGGQCEEIARLNSLIANSERDNARLKAECQARQAENSVLAVECDSLKAEVERLTALVRQLRFERIYNFSEMGGQCEEIARLKAEVERLEQSIIDSVEMRQRLRQIEEGKKS